MRRAIACLAAALLLPACTGEDKPSVRPSAGATTPPVLATAKPKVTVPSGPAPTTLVQEDLKVGTGALLVPGHTASVHYVGVDYATGKEFGSSWASGHPLQFIVGDDEVIQGWDKGVLGMRVGGQRRLVIPPALAYGPDPDEHELGGKTLVFVIDLIATGGGRPADPFATPGG